MNFHKCIRLCNDQDTKQLHRSSDSLISASIAPPRARLKKQAALLGRGRMELVRVSLSCGLGLVVPSAPLAESSG